MKSAALTTPPCMQGQNLSEMDIFFFQIKWRNAVQLLTRVKELHVAWPNSQTIL